MLKFDKIVKIEDVGLKEAYDLEVNDSDHLFLGNKILISNSHSNFYGLLSHRQLWQKFHYPIEFYCSMLNIESIDEIHTIVKSLTSFPARKFVDGNEIEYYIKLEQPNFKRMNFNFEIEGDSINFGLSKVKYLSEETLQFMKDNLTEEDIDDFDKLVTKKAFYINDKGKQVSTRIMGKSAFEALIYSGALDYFGKDLPKIEILHGLIWLSLSGYAKDDIDSVIGSFYFGLYYLEQGLKKV